MNRPTHRLAVPPISRRTLLAGSAAAALGLLTGCNSDASQDATKSGRTTVKILSFSPPSLGAFLPAVIEANRIDQDHNLEIEYTYTTPDNYNTEFSSGHFQVGGSAALLSEALRTERNVDVTYLFNLFDFFTAVVTDRAEIKSLTDLPGKRLAAATGTTNHAMFAWFAGKAGLDLSKVQIMNQTTAGLSTMALTGQTDATALWEPAYSSLLAKKPTIRTLEIGMGNWKAAFGTDTIPYLGLAAHRKWINENPDAVKNLYAAYGDAAKWTTENPAKAAEAIAKVMPNGQPKVIQALIENNDQLQMNVASAASLKDPISSVFEAGKSTGYLKKTPPASIIYGDL